MNNVPNGLIYELAHEYLDGGGDPGNQEAIRDFAIASEISGLKINPDDLNDAIQTIVVQA